jgi:hypothetical protein
MISYGRIMNAIMNSMSGKVLMMMTLVVGTIAEAATNSEPSVPGVAQQAPPASVSAAAGSSHSPAQDPRIGVFSTGPKPFAPEDSAVFGGIPKEIFPTRVLYNVGPTFLREAAITNDGTQFHAPLNRRQWRQVVFELGRSKLYPDVLPDYMAFLTRARDFRWDHSFENGEPILIANVRFEWLADDLDHNPELEKKAEYVYKLREGVGSLTTSKGQFFAASLVPQTLCYPLVTFFLNEDFVYSNTGDRVIGVDVEIEKTSFSVPMGTSRVVDLGDREGIRTVHLTAHYSSGRQSKCCFDLLLQKANGAWLNTKEVGGEKTFSFKRAASVHYTREDDHR